ncbi:MAG: hypothetical protein ACPGQO_02575, partial [Candidatus Poseidoniaceae archaeon]
EKLNTLIENLLSATAEELSDIAQSDLYFGLASATSIEDREAALRMRMAMEAPVGMLEPTSGPSANLQGSISEDDGHEYLEHPEGSGQWFLRDESGEWRAWK